MCRDSPRRNRIRGGTPIPAIPPRHTSCRSEPFPNHFVRSSHRRSNRRLRGLRRRRCRSSTDRTVCRLSCRRNRSGRCCSPRPDRTRCRCRRRDRLRNLNRSQSESGIFGDIQINSFDIECDDATLGGLINASGVPSSLTILADSAADITVSLFSGAFKLANSGTLLGISSRCSITFNGQDLSGEPILSQEAIFSYSFVDVP